MTVHVDNGIDVQFPNGHTEHVACGEWWVSEGVLHTDKVRYVAPMNLGYTLVRGPSFSVANVKKWEESRA